jgi:hypothetical protein
MPGRLALAVALLLGLPAEAAADAHREAILRLVSISSALRQEARALQDRGMLGMEVQSRMPAPECAELLQDVLSLRNLQAVAAPGGAVSVRWHGKRDLQLRLERAAGFSLEVHDKAGLACAATRVEAREKGAWQGRLTPLLLEYPGMRQGPARVFAVDPVRSPPRAPLD